MGEQQSDFCVPGLGDQMESAWKLQEQVSGTIKYTPVPGVTSEILAESYKDENARCSRLTPQVRHPLVASGRKAFWMFAAKDPAPQGPRCPLHPSRVLHQSREGSAEGGPAPHLGQLCPMPGGATEGND